MSAVTKAVTNTASRRSVPKGSFSWPRQTPEFIKSIETNAPIQISEEHNQPPGSWSPEQISNAVQNHVMLTWAPGKARYGIPQITHGKGVYLYGVDGKKYIDWTSQAVCNNVGLTLPPAVIEAVTHQMQTLPFVYGGMGMSEIRARLSHLISEILPGDLKGMVFPSSGSEANEAAIAMARRHTGKYKVINWYRGYHGGTANSQAATGDWRRWYGGDRVPGFVKAFDPRPLFFELKGDTEEEYSQMALNMLEEQILNEGPDHVALIQFESVVGGGGVHMPPKGYMQGVRAICDKYDILLHLDEVMVGFGRTGKMFAFQHYDGVLPDIVTAAKGLTAAALPLSMTVCRKHIMDSFEDKPLGWGSTYQAHPVSMAAAYENVKFLINEGVIDHVQTLAPVLEEGMKDIAERHPCIKQYRSVGLFGCFDVHGPNGENPQLQHEAFHHAFLAYKKAYTEQGLMGVVRPPALHIAPALTIKEDELLDGLERNDQALYALDEALGFGV